MKKILLALCLISNISFASDRIYIDEKELDNSEHCFHIHTGSNLWIQTDTIHKDDTGLYTLEKNLIKRHKSTEYEKKWKCPYCFQYWKIGQACQNPECPSKYKFN